MRSPFTTALALIAGLFVLALASVQTVRPVSAATFTVLNINDAGAGSLRQAILDANANGTGLDTIDATGVAGTITLTTGELLINSALVINGPGANVLTVSGNNTSRVLFINFGLTSVTVNGLTIANGNNSSNGGGVSARSPSTFNDVAIINSTSGLVNNFGAGGGGIFASQTLVLNRVTMSGNQGLGGAGGGALQLSSTTAILNNVTISGNQVPGVPNVTASEGGGIFASQSTVNLNNVTITNNLSSGNGGGGIRLLSNSTANVRNSIIAGNTSTATSVDCSATGTNVFNSLGYNIIGNATGCNITGTTTGNKLGVDPLLGPLANNGGPTQTHALQAGSPALDAGDPAGCNGTGGGLPTADQRGQPRPFDADGNGAPVCDAGAYEAQTNLGVSAPAVAKSFSPASIAANGTTTLTITLTNTSATPLTGVAISDTFPSGLQVATPPNATNTCGGTFAATANQTSIALAGGSLGANGSCSISVQVQATSTGALVNTTGPLTAAQTLGGAATGSATLSVAAVAVSPTATPTVAPVVQAPLQPIPQVFQNPAALGAIFAGSGPNATPQPRPAVAPAAPPPAQSPAGTTQPVLRPPSTGDAGLLTP